MAKTERASVSGAPRRAPGELGEGVVDGGGVGAVPEPPPPPSPRLHWRGRRRELVVRPGANRPAAAAQATRRLLARPLRRVKHRIATGCPEALLADQMRVRPDLDFLSALLTSRGATAVTGEVRRVHELDVASTWAIGSNHASSHFGVVLLERAARPGWGSCRKGPRRAVRLRHQLGRVRRGAAGPPTRRARGGWGRRPRERTTTQRRPFVFFPRARA